MKKIILTISLFVFTLFNYAQTAVNFNCNDCSGNNHDLFATLNSGKVVVITWVMPCATCLGPALAAQTAVQSFSNSNPGQVLYYVVDDYANTACISLTGWCTANGINMATVFSNSTINMSDYGLGGMPKIVVVGDANHTVYYNQNGVSTVSSVQNAINNALAAIASKVSENEIEHILSMGIYPNPSNSESSLVLNLYKDSDFKIEIQNLLGQKVSEIFTGRLLKGENNIKIKNSDLVPGTYIVNVSNGEHSNKLKLLIER